MISIITVNFNNGSHLEQTIKSVLNMNFKEYEYIIIDGGSIDNSVEIIKSYEKDFFNKHIPYLWVSEKDNGIYDAMNKGIEKSSGNWLNFMNSGDKFYSNEVLSNIFTKNNCQYKSLIYGYKAFKEEIHYPLSVSYLKKGLIMANHQSMFFNKEVIKSEMYYDLNYPIYGDYELVNRLFKVYGKNSFEYIKEPITIYQGGGISERPSSQKRKDKFLILWKSYGLIGLVRGLLYALEHKISNK